MDHLVDPCNERRRYLGLVPYGLLLSNDQYQNLRLRLVAEGPPILVEASRTSRGSSAI